MLILYSTESRQMETDVTGQDSLGKFHNLGDCYSLLLLAAVNFNQVKGKLCLLIKFLCFKDVHYY